MDVHFNFDYFKHLERTIVDLLANDSSLSSAWANKFEVVFSEGIWDYRPKRIRRVSLRRARVINSARRKRGCHTPKSVIRYENSYVKSVCESHFGADIYCQSCFEHVSYDYSVFSTEVVNVLLWPHASYSIVSGPFQIDEKDEPLIYDYLQETEYYNPSLIFYPNLPVALTPGRLSAAVNLNRPKSYSGPWSICLLASHRFRIYISSDDEDHELYPNTETRVFNSFLN